MIFPTQTAKAVTLAEYIKGQHPARSIADVWADLPDVLRATRFFAMAQSGLKMYREEHRKPSDPSPFTAAEIIECAGILEAHYRHKTATNRHEAATKGEGDGD